MLSTASRWAVLDAKHDYPVARGATLTSEFKPRIDRQVIRVAPDRDEADRWDEAIYGVLDRGDCILYVDEVTLINTSRTQIRPSLGAAIRTGRSLGVGVWCGSQRPKDIPSAVFTETEHFFLFRLTYDADREKVVAFTSSALASTLARVRGHSFVYWNVLTESGLYVRG